MSQGVVSGAQNRLGVLTEGVCLLQTSAAEVEEAKLKLQQAQAAAEAGKPSQNPQS